MKFQFTSRQVEIAVIALLLLITSLFMLHIDDTDAVAGNTIETIEQTVDDTRDSSTLITYNNQ